MNACIIQARVGSTRLPRKVLKRVGSKKILQYVIDRCKQSEADKVVLIVPNSTENNILVGFGGLENYRGDESDVLGSYYEAAKKFGVEYICRVTADCPLIDHRLVSRCLSIAPTSDFVACEGFPNGVDCEAFSFELLGYAHIHAVTPYDREHVVPYMLRSKCHIETICNPTPRNYRVCVDEYPDLLVVRHIVNELGENCTTEEIIKFLDAHPETVKINANVKQKKEPVVDYWLEDWMDTVHAGSRWDLTTKEELRRLLRSQGQGS